jgi:hypothetical protein
MNDILFRHLDPAEVEDFKAWARDNYVPGTPVSPLWHPVIREECRLINAARPKRYVVTFTIEIGPLEATSKGEAETRAREALRDGNVEVEDIGGDALMVVQVDEDG